MIDLAFPIDRQGRQSGRTSYQMEEAPHGAVYVTPLGRTLPYYRNLAIYLGRQDLRIVAPYQLMGFRGLAVPALVVDHACDNTFLTREHWHAIEQIADHVS